MEYVKAFVVGGAICAAVQLLMDNTKLMPGRIMVILVCRVFPVDNSASFHVVSFIRIKDHLIAEMDEYWSDDGAAPEWRRKMKIGTTIK